MKDNHYRITHFLFVLTFLFSHAYNFPLKKLKNYLYIHRQPTLCSPNPYPMTIIVLSQNSRLNHNTSKPLTSITITSPIINFTKNHPKVLAFFFIEITISKPESTQIVL